MIVECIVFTVTEYLYHKWLQICSVCRNHNPYFVPHSSRITEFVTKVLRRVSLVEQKLCTFPGHLCSPPFQWGTCSSIFSFLCRVLLTFLLSFLFWPLYYQSFELRLLITTLVSSDYHLGIFLLPLGYLLITTLISSDYHFDIFWLPLWYLLITIWVSSDYHFDIFWLPLWYLLITTLVSSDYHLGIFWLPLGYLQTFHFPVKGSYRCQLCCRDQRCHVK